jgi:hypothetical protein
VLLSSKASHGRILKRRFGKVPNEALGYFGLVKVFCFSSFPFWDRPEIGWEERWQESF